MRRLAIIVAILAALGLSACGPSLDEVQHRAKVFCADKGGIKNLDYTEEYSILDPSYYNAECHDGSEIN